MEYTTLGSTGLSVSELCLGTARFGREVTSDRSQRLQDPIINYEEAHDLLDTAHEHGINFIDTANTYGRPHEGRTERWIGDWLADHDRDQFVIASKVWGDMSDRPNDKGCSRKHIRAALRDTLDRLDTEYLDVYYLHRWDDSTPIRETLTTLDDLVSEGKIHYLGMSVTAAWKLTKALWTSDVHNLEPFTITQPRYNAVYREEIAEYLDVCADQQLAVCPYSPLAGGFLTGKYERSGSTPVNSRGERDNWTDRFSKGDWAVLDAIREVATETGASPLQVSLRWLIDHDRFDVVPVIGARTVDQLEENAATTDVTLTAEQWTRISNAAEESRKSTANEN